MTPRILEPIFQNLRQILSFSMDFSFKDIFHCKPMFYPQGNLLRVVPGPENHFDFEHKISFYYLLKILYSFSSKNTFSNTGEKHIIHF